MTPAQIEVRRALAGKSARDFLLKNPRVSHHQLQSRLRTNLSALRLTEGLGLECKATGDLEWFARDLFLRELWESGGMHRGDDGSSDALDDATTSLGFVDQAFAAHAARASRYLIGAPFIPEGWVPQTADDPLLVEAFDATR